MKQRAKELDFLRGIAILLVMLRHSNLSALTTQVGWIGVDLFFVLSGFLVSGILFSEYKKNGTIKPLHFLIRRGFKIYPLFFVVLFLHVFYFLWKDIPLYGNMILPEIFFYQNYVPGIMGISWSLAIEEHFYFSLSIALFIVSIKKKMAKVSMIPLACGIIAVICLVLRIIVNIQVKPFDPYIHFFPTHLRIDSLAFGVLISWFYHFTRDWLYITVHKLRYFSLVALPLLFCPVFVWQPESTIITTWGFTFLYLGFGIILALMTVYSEKIKSWLKRLHLLLFFNTIAWVGVYSYSIYLVHLKAGPILSNLFTENIFAQAPHLLVVTLFLFFNILSGYILSLIIEQPFLRFRDKYFPRK